MIWKHKQKKYEAEFTDEEGQKWVQTSAEDLFSVKELNDIIDSIEKEKNSSEIVLAHIDFKKVNKEYYDSVMQLQSELKKKNDLLEKLLSVTQSMIYRKNIKLDELIKYIKKLHLLLAYYKQDPENIKKIDISDRILAPSREVTDSEVEEIEFQDVQEIMLDGNGIEIASDK